MSDHVTCQSNGRDMSNSIVTIGRTLSNYEQWSDPGSLSLGTSYADTEPCTVVHARQSYGPGPLDLV
jgi:hypothetical protein